METRLTLRPGRNGTRKLAALGLALIARR